MKLCIEIRLVFSCKLYSRLLFVCSNIKGFQLASISLTKFLQEGSGVQQLSQIVSPWSDNIEHCDKLRQQQR